MRWGETRRERTTQKKIDSLTLKVAAVVWRIYRSPSRLTRDGLLTRLCLWVSIDELAGAACDIADSLHVGYIESFLGCRGSFVLIAERSGLGLSCGKGKKSRQQRAF